MNAVVAVTVICVCSVDAADVDTRTSSSSLATAAAAPSSGDGHLFMMNLLVHSLTDDDAGLKLAVELALKRDVQVLLGLSCMCVVVAVG